MIDLTRMVRLGDVIETIDHFTSPPDSYFYAMAHERSRGWIAAAERIKAEVLRAIELADELAADDAPPPPTPDELLGSMGA